MPHPRLILIFVWNKISMPLVAALIILIIATDRRPDDTTIRLVLATGVLGLFSAVDLSISGAWRQPNSRKTSPILPTIIASFLIFCTFSAFWAGQPYRTLEVSAVAWGMFLAWLSTRYWADRQPRRRIVILLRWLCAAVLILAALLASEVATSQLIHRYFMNTVGMTMAIPNYYGYAEDHITVLDLFLNQHMGTISYLFWPTLMAIYLTFGWWKLLGLISLSVLTAYSVFHSINETAMIALAVSAVAFVTALVLPRTAVVSIAVILVITSLAMVPLVYVAHDVLQLQFNANIPASGQARIPIWYNVAGAVGERFLFGHGVVHLQTLLNMGDGFIWEHAHSHNVLLQTWYETGLIGSTLCLLMGLIVLVRLYNYSQHLICFGVATYVTVLFSFITTAWELWVPWHIGLISMVGSIVVLVDRCRGSSGNAPVFGGGSA